ncbi:ATP-dependent helicase [Amphiplicatus metriothermophilus]|uniref:DNA 3'-5' helicase n=1 Tax=Amphiplicatus metriothermophilus TaxID=1519374 RepID=A0A239PT95_9PROT|nr:UvrD-helicase domain-containing protein [Amphiplicatus metriothermophilus]MBB5519269.1 DNA helicase-2/ATP-dependent DNA helicase PcrA [Amphiplicatus metriothermophilus]SNT73338.1 DNA helicase-2 / ATP-dependent DNA helicase PcrA [Amphiplicatus metriothermophilus]
MSPRPAPKPSLSELAQAGLRPPGLSEAPAAFADAPYLQCLNDEQRAAVLATEGPVLVLAGAGTGKTRALTTRLAHLLFAGKARPWQILAVTFTNKAAREMKERVGALIGQGRGGVEGMQWLGTFHSIGAQILRRHAELVGLRPSFAIIDADDQARLAKQAIEAAGLDEKRWTGRGLAAMIDGWKNRGLTPDKVPASEAHHFADGRAIALYAAYQARLKTLNAADFGDLLVHNLTIFQNRPDVLADYQNRFRYMLVDEYQDTNVAQYLWLRLLAQKHRNICCVGDDDQSIYGWRGAEVENILRFEKDFPGATVIRLERNYRSTPAILAAASGLISANRARLGKTLWTEREDGEPVRLRGVWDGEEEARVVADDIEAEQMKGRPLSDMAVLVRASFQMRAFEERFNAIGVPYKVVGGPRFYEREETRDALAYLRLIRSADDDLSFERVVNKPRRGLGEKALQTLHRIARDAGVSLAAAGRLALETDDLTAAARKALARFLDDLDRWARDARDMPPADIAELVLEESGYIDMWKTSKSAQADSKLDNLKELVQAASEFDALEGYLDHVALVSELNESSVDGQVWLMTLHAAKGLEFPVVFLPGWEEGIFPSQRALDEKGEAALEEERRLAYVGVTRAKESCRISFAANRQIFGRWQNAIPSRFIDELPEDAVDVVSEPGLYGAAARNFARRSAFDGARIDEDAYYDNPGWRRARAAKARAARPPLIEGRAATVSVSAPGKSRFSVGQRVFHQKFGYGKVTAADGQKLVVDFDHTGPKKVIDAFLEGA